MCLVPQSMPPSSINVDALQCNIVPGCWKRRVMMLVSACGSSLSC